MVVLEHRSLHETGLYAHQQAVRCTQLHMKVGFPRMRAPTFLVQCESEFPGRGRRSGERGVPASRILRADLLSLEESLGLWLDLHGDVLTETAS